VDDGLDDVGGAVGLRHEQAVVRDLLVDQPIPARGQDEPDVGPRGVDAAGQGLAAHGPWHVDVGEQDADIRASVQDVPSLVGVTGLDRRQACILQHLDRVQAHESVVLDDDDHGGIQGALRGHGPSLWGSEVGCPRKPSRRKRHLAPCEPPRRRDTGARGAAAALPSEEP
jgi:hypothetical protein